MTSAWSLHYIWYVYNVCQYLSNRYFIYHRRCSESSSPIVSFQRAYELCQPVRYQLMVNYQLQANQTVSPSQQLTTKNESQTIHQETQITTARASTTAAGNPHAAYPNQTVNITQMFIDARIVPEMIRYAPTEICRVSSPWISSQTTTLTRILFRIRFSTVTAKSIRDLFGITPRRFFLLWSHGKRNAIPLTSYTSAVRFPPIYRVFSLLILTIR